MRCVTLLLSGVPQNVTLIQLSTSLDQLFDTNEIGTFKLRNLPYQCGKRQIAVDFRSGFDAIEAQKRLDGYHYELSNGREYTLSAKITRREEFLRTRSPSVEERSESCSAMVMVPFVSDGTLFRANVKLDAQLELLRKQKLILRTKREVLREKKKLKRDYYLKSIFDSDEEATSPKRRRRLRPRESSSSRERSSSRELKFYTKSSKTRDLREKLRSKSPGHRMLALNSSSTEPGSKWGLMSRSRDQGLRTSKKPGSKSRERRSSSRDRGLSSSKKLRSKSRERRSRSKDPGLRTSKNPGSKSRERRSRSRDRRLSSSKKPRSKSRERWSRSKHPSLKSPDSPRSKSRERSSSSKEPGLRTPKKPRSKLRRTRSRSKDPGLRTPKKPLSKSRETRSQSRDRGLSSRDGSKDGSTTRYTDLSDRSPPWHIDPIGRRSTSREARNRRSRSRDYSPDYYKMEAYSASTPWEWDNIGRSRERSWRDRKSRSREPEDSLMSWRRRSFRPLAIMPRSPVHSRWSPNQRKTRVHSRVDYADEGDDAPCYYRRNLYNDFNDIKKATSSLEIRRNSTITSDSSASKEESAPTDKTKQITVDLARVKTEEDDNKTTESEKNKIGNDNVGTNLDANDKIVPDSVNEKENEFTDANENTRVIDKKLTKAEERNRIASEDVMFLMETLVDEILIKENIAVSETRKMFNDKLKPLIQDRITPLIANENYTSLNILLRYRQLYKKQDDATLIKKLLGEIPEDQNSSAKVAGDVAENVIYTSQHRDPVHKGNYGPHDTVSNTAEIIEIVDTELSGPKDLDRDRKIENQAPITVINLTQDNDKYTKRRPEQLPKRPQFVLVIKRLWKQMKQSIRKADERTKEPFPTVQFKNVLKSIIRDSLKGKGHTGTFTCLSLPALQKVASDEKKRRKKLSSYMSTAEILGHFRARHPIAKDDEFVEKVLEEVKTGKYITDVEDKDDVLLIERKHDVITVLDSDDEEDELMKNLDDLIKEEPVTKINSEIQLTERKEAEATLQSQDKTSFGVIPEVFEVKTNNSELKEITIKKEATANADIGSESEHPYLPNLIEQNGVADKEIIKINEVKTELTDVAVEEFLDSFKDIDGLDNALKDTTATETPQVTSITIVTSYSELCSLKNDDNKNKNVSKQVDIIKKERDVDVETGSDRANEKIIVDINNKNNIVPTTVKTEPQEDEECIESITKYVEAFCSDIVIN